MQVHSFFFLSLSVRLIFEFFTSPFHCFLSSSLFALCSQRRKLFDVCPTTAIEPPTQGKLRFNNTRRDRPTRIFFLHG